MEDINSSIIMVARLEYTDYFSIYVAHLECQVPVTAKRFREPVGSLD